MIQMDKQLLTMIAAIVCVAACVYLFKEMKQAKEDVDGLKMVQTKMMQHMMTPPPQPRPYGMPVAPPSTQQPPKEAVVTETTASEPEEIVEEK